MLMAQSNPRKEPRCVSCPLVKFSLEILYYLFAHIGDIIENDRLPIGIAQTDTSNTQSLSKILANTDSILKKL